MRDIEPLGEYGVVDEQDVDKALEKLAAGTRYAASDLYARYSDAAREAGRTPGHAVAFGQSLKRRGLIRVKTVVGGAGRGHKGRGKQVSAWVI
jgi:hypothetical protein